VKKLHLPFLLVTGHASPALLLDVEHDLAEVPANSLGGGMPQWSAPKENAYRLRDANYWLRSLLPCPAAIFGCPQVKPASVIAGQGPTLAGGSSQRPSASSRLFAGARKHPYPEVVEITGFPLSRE